MGGPMIEILWIVLMVLIAIGMVYGMHDKRVSTSKEDVPKGGIMSELVLDSDFLYEGKRILFITKEGPCYGYGYSDTPCYSHSPSGLVNSSLFIVNMLKKHGVEAKLVGVVDNNDIDREVHKFKPDVVIIEAFWVVPEKFDELIKLYPNVQWVIRIHSDIPFLTQEGIAIGWIREYAKKPNIYIGFNKHKTMESFRHIVSRHKLVYLPNYYPVGHHSFPEKNDLKLVFHAGCFGAIRPLKNQLIQAFAAIKYADDHQYILHFHINATRVEGGGGVLKNLQSLFKHSKHKLVEHPWYTHEEFQKVLKGMDVSMCVSFSETFCIVAADSVSLGVPLVCSSEVSWADKGSMVPTTSVEDIADGINTVVYYKACYQRLNKNGLKYHDDKSVKVWKEFLQTDLTVSKPTYTSMLDEIERINEATKNKEKL